MVKFEIGDLVHFRYHPHNRLGIYRVEGYGSVPDRYIIRGIESYTEDRTLVGKLYDMIHADEWEPVEDPFDK